MNAHPQVFGYMALLLLAILGACEPAPAPTNLARTSDRTRGAIVHLLIDRTALISNAGVGVMLDTGEILTAAHIARSIDNDQTRPRLVLSPLHRHEVRIRTTTAYARVYDARDLARVYAVPTIETDTTLRVANSFPGIGGRARAVFVSHHRGSEFVKEEDTTILGVSRGGLMFAIAGRAVPGDAGGPVVNEQGELIGIIIGGSTNPYGKMTRFFQYWPTITGQFDAIPAIRDEDVHIGYYTICANVVPDLE